MNNSERIFITNFYEINSDQENKIVVGYHNQFDTIYLIKNNKLINDVVSYIKSGDYVKDIPEAYYYLLLLAAYNKNVDGGFVCTFYVQHKKHIQQSIKKIYSKNRKRGMDIFILKQYDIFIDQLFSF